jgi:hypothetical protein
MRLKMFVTVSLVVGLSTPLFSSASSEAAISTKTPACTNLVVAASSSLGAGGTGAVIILVANAGKRCRLEGYPKVVFYNIHGVGVDSINLHQPSMRFGEPTPKLITLPSSSVASFGVSWADNGNNNEKCPAAAWTDVSLPTGIGSFHGYPGLAQAAPCGGTLYVTPLEAGAVPAPSNG